MRSGLAVHLVRSLLCNGWSSPARGETKAQSQERSR